MQLLAATTATAAAATAVVVVVVLQLKPFAASLVQFGWSCRSRYLLLGFGALLLTGIKRWGE